MAALPVNRRPRMKSVLMKGSRLGGHRGRSRKVGWSSSRTGRGLERGPPRHASAGRPRLPVDRSCHEGVSCRAAIDRSSSSTSSRNVQGRRGGGLSDLKESDAALRDDVLRMKDLVLCLKGRDARSKVAILGKDPVVRSCAPLGYEDHIAALSLDRQVVLYSMLAARQDHVLRTGSVEDSDLLSSLLGKLELVEQFYDSIGGIVGYQLKVLQLILGDDEAGDGDSEEEVLFPPGQDISDGTDPATVAMVEEGLRAIPDLAEVYPVGGAGDRLGLIDEATGQPLPTALLPYCGRSLLENLVRDVQARESLYYRIYGERHCTPIAIMTSDAKGNHEHIVQLCEENGWFGRSKDSFRLFRQPLVPVLSGEDGKWLVTGVFEILMKPSGHGAIWKLMYDRDVLRWFGGRDRGSALVRQISNPMAATDTTMIALAGKGHAGGHVFGFASCERKVGASEGCNVLKSYEGSAGDSPREAAITCVEYTEFQRYGLQDTGKVNSDGEEVSRYPANTNILYFDVKRVQAKLDEGAKLGQRGTPIILPGMIFNRNKTIRYTNRLTGEQEEVKGGRLECSMQNLADVFRHELGGGGVHEPTWLPTFLLYNKRPKVTSSAKKRYEPSSEKGSISQTPEGSFYDLMRNAGELLAKCGMAAPALNTVSEYLKEGPSFIFLFHPALGPLWSVISQKVRGGSLAEKSELVLEIAEVSIRGVDLAGSLLVRAENVLGEVTGSSSGPEGNIRYSDKCGKCTLRDVRVENKGIDFSETENIYWKHEVRRLESCQILLQGNSEFVAEGVTLRGDQSFVVPDGHRMVVRAGEGGEIVQECEPLEVGGWIWEYELCKDKGVVLK